MNGFYFKKEKQNSWRCLETQTRQLFFSFFDGRIYAFKNFVFFRLFINFQQNQKCYLRVKTGDWLWENLI